MEITPLIDVVFLLLIFFMVSTTFVRETALAVDLPNADGVAQALGSAIIEVRVSAAGAYAVDDRILAGDDPEALGLALREARDGIPELPGVVVAADAAARHDAVVRVLDTARRLGLTRVRILTEARHTAPDDETEDGG